MLTITCVLFDPAAGSRLPERSRVYSPEWVDTLWRMLDRNLLTEWRMVCLTHYPQSAFCEGVVAVPFLEDTREVWCINEVFRPDLGAERGMFLALDTVIVKNIDHMAEYSGLMALPRYHAGAKLKYTNPMALYSKEAADLLWNQAREAYRDPWVMMREFGPSEMRFWARYAPKDTEDIHALWPRQLAPYQLLRDGPVERMEVRPAPPDEMLKSVRIISFGFSEEKPHNTTIGIAKEHWK